MLGRSDRRTIADNGSFAVGELRPMVNRRAASCSIVGDIADVGWRRRCVDRPPRIAATDAYWSTTAVLGSGELRVARASLGADPEPGSSGSSGCICALRRADHFERSRLTWRGGQSWPDARSRPAKAGRRGLNARSWVQIPPSPLRSPGLAGRSSRSGLQMVAAERVGFEPTDPCGSTTFKAVAFVHSATAPGATLRR